MRKLTACPVRYLNHVISWCVLTNKAGCSAVLSETHGQFYARFVVLYMPLSNFISIFITFSKFSESFSLSTPKGKRESAYMRAYVVILILKHIVEMNIKDS
jgi:hypothetical protein